MGTTQPIREMDNLTQFREYYMSIENNPRNYALIVFGLNSALRISDMLGLHWYDICKNGIYNTHISIKEKKTGKINRIVLNKASIFAFEQLRSFLIKNKKYNEQNYIFCSQKYPYNNIGRSQAFLIVKKAAIHCGLTDNVSCHSLRKTFGYFAWKQGTPPALLMSIYNHSSYEITKRYLCIDQSEKDEVYYKMTL
ncbi:MAG: tyrosine-type recombinase/integrase [Lachnospiraceae bacterium]|nr:tyrosine-type recombinase/integrase [Lachnospiraceae bacterium]